MFDEWTNKMLADEINEYGYWDEIACRELCKRAGLETEWENAVRIILKKLSIMQQKFWVYISTNQKTKDVLTNYTVE